MQRGFMHEGWQFTCWVSHSHACVPCATHSSLAVLVVKQVDTPLLHASVATLGALTAVAAALAIAGSSARRYALKQWA